MLNYFLNIEFQEPWMFLLLGLIPIAWYVKRVKTKQQDIPLSVPDLSMLPEITSFRQILAKVLPYSRLLALSALVFALARPQLTLKEEVVKAEGIDIVLAIDLSSSMLSRDFKPDRLEVSKQVAIDFVDKREHDRVGLAVFAGESYTQCPLTTDHRIVKDFLSSLQCGILSDGTAIGMGLATAVNRLKDSPAKSKIIILLTDGVNNAGYIKPLTAAEIAQEYGVKVYTIGVGSTGSALTPINQTSDGRYRFGMAKVEIDEALLREISAMTDGQYFRATDEESLDKIYATIDQLEKTEIEVSVFKRYKEEFRKFLGFGLILLLIEFILRNTWLRSEFIP
jgi:Ca-activated chloride channel family protein